MSLELYLVPIDVYGDYPYGHTLLKCDKGGAIFERLKDAPNYPVPNNMTCFYSHENSNDTIGYGAVDKADAYSRPIVCYRVHSLKAALRRGSCSSPRNRAVRAYLSTLLAPDDLVVAIWA